jgi:hypothetical protein
VVDQGEVGAGLARGPQDSIEGVGRLPVGVDVPDLQQALDRIDDDQDRLDPSRFFGDPVEETRLRRAAVDRNRVAARRPHLLQVAGHVF